MLRKSQGSKTPEVKCFFGRKASVRWEGKILGAVEESDYGVPMPWSIAYLINSAFEWSPSFCMTVDL